MARIYYTSIVDEIRGSIGGTTFQRNGYGFTVKRLGTQPVPPSPQQFPRKTATQVINQQWRSLTDVQRQDWRDWATANPQESQRNPGEYLTGANLFQRYHYYQQMRSAPSLLTSPSGALGSITDGLLTVTRNTSDMTATFTYSAIVQGWRIWVFLSKPLTGTKVFTDGLPRYIISTLTAGTGYSATFSANYANKFGALANAGDVLAAKYVAIRTLNPQAIFYPTQLLTVL